MKLRLNLNRDDDHKKQSLERINQANESKKASEETLSDAWKRIFAMNNTKTDTERLLEIYECMKSGTIHRDSTKLGKRFSKAEALSLWRAYNESQREVKLSEMVTHTPDNYWLIDSELKMSILLDHLKNETIIALDTETTGVDYFEDVLVGVSITLPIANIHVYIPFGHNEGSQLDKKVVLQALKPYLENETLQKVLHNARFDIHMLYYDRDEPINLKGLVHDTMIAMHILNENEPSFRLKDLATKYLNAPSDTFDTLFGRDCKFNTVPLNVATVYASKDTHLTWRLYEFQMKHLQKQPKLLNVYQKVENPLIQVVIEMEQAGFVIDTEYATTLGHQLNAEMIILEQKIYEVLGDINLNSPSQMKPALEKLAGRKLDSTDKHTLKLLKDTFPVVQDILDYKEKMKLHGTYVDALPKQIKWDGRVHGSFNQSGTVTGRFSSNNPNLQNQPKYARKLFTAPKGMVLLTGDFSQQEPRLLAHFSGEESLIQSYIDGEDLYSKSASEVFNLPIEECGDGSKYRKMMKMGILAVMYGTSPQTLATQLGISVKESEEFIENFYKKYQKVKKWIDGNIAFAKKHGYVEMLGGRKRRLIDINSSDKWERLRAERQCTNAIIQGSAAIQTKLTMIALHQLCLKKGWQMALSVHDEIGVYAPDNLTREDIEEFNQVMINTVKLIVPNKSDIELFYRWGEGLKVNEYLSKKGLI